MSHKQLLWGDTYEFMHEHYVDEICILGDIFVPLTVWRSSLAFTLAALENTILYKMYVSDALRSLKIIHGY